jgi:hypothetical protein
MTMVYAYYLGELIQSSVTPKEKWNEFVKEQQIPNPYYTYRGIIRTYTLFEQEPKQMYCTLTLTFRALSRMTNSQFNGLLQYRNNLHNLMENIDLS